MKIRRSEVEPIAIRITNAENAFRKAVAEHFDKTPEEANRILRVFRQEKIVKIDPIMGAFTLAHGAFWEADVMDRALEMEAAA